MTPEQIKRRQYLLAGSIAFAILVCVIALLVTLMEDGPSLNISEGAAKEISITSAGKRINPQEIWVERMESASKLTQQRLETLEKLVQNNLKGSPEATQAIQQLQKEFAELKNSQGISQEIQQEPRSLEQSGDQGVSQAGWQAKPTIFPSASGQEIGEGGAPLFPGEGFPKNGFGKIVLNLKQRAGQKDIRSKKTVETTIPAGAYAKAVLLGGVDASTAVGSQSDPRPLLLRVVDHGNLPRRLKSDLKACHVLASAYGDLASERVYMRLEKLTCTEPLTGEIVETEVSGYISGEDGKAGVRGVVVDRSGDAVRSSFIAGLIGGMGDFLSTQQQRASYPISPFGVSQALSGKELLASGASQGVSNAMEKLADFYIKRAEQLQPVLQVAAGRQVDLIFTQGADIGSSSVKQTLQKVREQSRQDAIAKLASGASSSPPTQSLWGQHP
ncbi:MAG: TrbI/VirB10 family protein [Alphaproteobacteria bacterium]